MTKTSKGAVPARFQDPRLRFMLYGPGGGALLARTGWNADSIRRAAWARAFVSWAPRAPEPKPAGPRWIMG